MFAVGFGVEWDQLPDGLLIYVRGGRPWMVLVLVGLVFVTGAAFGVRFGYRLGRARAHIAGRPKHLQDVK